MTSISSSFFSLPINALNGITALTGSQTASTSPAAGNSSDIFGSAFSLSLSDGGMSAMSDNSDSAAATLNALTYSNYSSNAQPGTSSFEAMMANLSGSSSGQDSTGTGDSTDQLMNFVNQVFSSIENSLDDINSNKQTAQASTTATDPFDTSSSSFAESALASGGPLPAFLAEVDAGYHLDPAHQQALQNIANENMDITNTPANVQKIAAELDQAGIQPNA